MKYMELENKKNYYQDNKHLIAKEVDQNYANYFRVDYTHNSTAIEGNTISLAETKLLLEDKVSIGGKDLREVYEIINHNKAFDYIQKCILEDKKLSESVVKESTLKRWKIMLVTIL